MMEDKFFRYALLISLTIHVLFLTKLSYSKNNPFLQPLKTIEVTYFNIKSQMKKQERIAQPKQEIKKEQERRTQVSLKEPSETDSFIKDLSKLLDKIELPKKQPAQVNKDQVKRKITVPPLSSEKIDNPMYLSYYQIIRNNIREKTYENYDQYDTGKVYLTFVVSSDGILKQLKLSEERTMANIYLKELSQKSVKDASPFPPFPDNLKFPELTFNVVISYEIEE
ncbi:MAG: hypothetical protein ABIJ41_06015 [Candidatus Omnitrophota bacterium]